MILKIENAKNGSRVINYVSKNGPDKESKFIYFPSIYGIIKY